MRQIRGRERHGRRVDKVAVIQGHQDHDRAAHRIDRPDSATDTTLAHGCGARTFACRAPSVTIGDMTRRPDRRHGLQFSRPTVGGLFRHVHRMRMLLAVKGSFAMINRIMPLTAPGHSQRTLSLQKEKAALNGPYNALCGSKWQPCRRSSLSAICQSPHLHLHILSGHHFRTQLHTQPRPRRQRKLSVHRRQRVGHDAAILIQVMPPDAFQDI